MKPEIRVLDARGSLVEVDFRVDVRRVCLSEFVTMIRELLDLGGHDPRAGTGIGRAEKWGRIPGVEHGSVEGNGGETGCVGVS